MKHFFLASISVALCLGGVSVANAATLFQDSFEKGTQGWTATHQAVVSDVSRRPGMKSLVIKQSEDTESDSAWLSPAIKNPGKAVKLSFWAVGNYLRCTDFSYSGCMDVVNYDKAGKDIGGSMYMVYIPWDDARTESMWGKLLPSGFVWKYYECVYTPGGDTFRLKFHWPKAIVRGDCYLTDVQVTEASAEDVTATAAKPAATTQTAAAKTAETNLVLELSTPVSANLFYQQDPLQFDALIYAAGQPALSLPPDAKLAYAITDFQHGPIFSGEAPLTAAKPVEDPAFISHFPQRKANLHAKVVISDEHARETGREFFLEVRLVSQGKTLAADTVPYGVVSPRPIAAADYDLCHFTTTYFSDGSSAAARKEAISEKTGASWSEIYDYNWKSSQPHYPGPFTFKEKLPPFPRVTYCPNLEQVRGRPDDHPWGAIATLCPPEALLPDPFHPGVKTFDIDGYVQYMVAYIRQNREAIARVVPSGLERPIDARTIELHKKAYTAIKKEFPDLPVGFMLYGLTMNPSGDVDQFLKEKLYDYCDFFDTHIYAAAVDWTEWDRLQRAYKAMGRKPVPLMSTEFCRVGGSDQIQRCRDMIAAHLDCFAHGMENLLYFNCTVGAPGSHPFLREPTDIGSGQESGFFYVQAVNRPKVAETADGSVRLLETGSLMPVLQAMTYYNLVQAFETASWRKTLTPGANSIAYVFDRKDVTVAALWLTNPMGAQTVAIKTPVAFTVQDLFGRKERIQPHDGIALLTMEYQPQTLIFDQKVDNLEITPVSGGIAADAIARGSKGDLTLNLPAIWKDRVACRVALAADGDWPPIKDVTVDAAPGKERAKTVSFSCPLSQRVGAYTLTGRVYAGKNLVGLLKTSLQVDELLTAEIEGVPLTHTTSPAIKVTLSNLQKTPFKGEVLFEDKSFAPGMTPELIRQPYTVPPRGKASVLIPVDKNLISLATAYNVAVEVRDASGINLTKNEEVSFRACERAPGKITIDGDLSDWNLAQRTPIPFERELTSYGKPSPTLDDLSGVFYTLWDDENVYFAAVVKDNSAVNRSMDINLWMDDNIMFGFYPWGWKQGENLHSGYYREHLGLCKDGVGRIFRVGNVDGGPTTSETAHIVVKRTADGYIYEWAYPKAALFPVELKSGARFRLSFFLLDVDQLPNGQYTELGGVQIGGFNSNVDARPIKWREFVMTE